MRSLCRRLSWPALLVAGLGLLLPACGLAEVDQGSTEAIAAWNPPPPDEPLAITTSVLPGAQEGGDYEPVQLLTSGASGPVSWTLAEGVLPGGVSLSPGGILSGRPAEEGLYPFEVAATDGSEVAVKRLDLVVGVLAITVDGWMLGDEIWGGEALTLQAVGAEGDVRFEVVDGASNGGFDFIDEAAGRAVWIPADPASPCIDHLRVVDTETGATADLHLEVLPHPARAMKAEFGATDVWYVASDHCTTSRGHGLPTDWDDALRQVGLRSSSYVPCKADRLADFLVRRSMLAALNEYFGRDADGSPGVGLDISFPFTRPQAPYATPAEGAWTAGAPGLYNTISLVCGPNHSMLGRAFVDDHANSLVENDTSTADGELGAFVDSISYGFNALFQNNWLPESPIGPADEALLRDLLHGRPVSGVRAEVIAWAVAEYGRSVAVILAHEIGHSLGLEHVDADVPDALMHGSTYHYPGARHAFCEASLEHLRHALPGPGRAVGSAKPDASSMPEGGIAACKMPAALGSCAR